MSSNQGLDDFYSDEKLRPLDNLAGNAIMALVQCYLDREKVYERAEVARRTQQRRNERAARDFKPRQERKRKANEQPDVPNKKPPFTEGHSAVQEGQQDF